ncbi:DUF2828 family protein [bacterium]|nr:DUF2828 family protein [bacterium]
MFSTHNGGSMAPNFIEKALEFFSKAGNIIGTRYYEDCGAGDGDVHSETKQGWKELFVRNPKKAMQLLFWSRDPRGGAGHRRLAKELLKDVANSSNYSIGRSWIKANLNNIVKYGRYDDLKAMYDTPLEEDVLAYYIDRLAHNDALCAKWMDRKDRKLRDAMEMTSKEYRNSIVRIAAMDAPVETLMSSSKWSEIDYSKVPSISEVRYVNAFMKNDPARFLEHVRKFGMKGGVAYPHEVMRLNRSTEHYELVEALFEGLPNFIKSGERIFPMVDVSGSMDVKVSGSVTAMDVSISLGMYCSDRLEGHLHRKMMSFASSPELIDWADMKVTDAIDKIKRSPWGFSTNISKALDLLLQGAKTFRATKKEMPSMLLILSDMQFDESVPTNEGWSSADEQETLQSLTEIDSAIERWKDAGYDAPGIVFWNLQNYDGQPSYISDNVAFISGFSPAVMESVLACTERDEDGSVTKLDPEAVMDKAISKYEVVDPFRA